MSINTAEAFELLFDKNNKTAYRALQELQKESVETDKVYPYMDRLGDMLDSDNSYIRTRGLMLIAYNARWDRDNKIDEIIDGYLKHIIRTFWLMPSNSRRSSLKRHGRISRFHRISSFHLLPMRLTVVAMGQSGNSAFFFIGFNPFNLVATSMFDVTVKL